MLMPQPQCEACWINEKAETLPGPDGDAIIVHVPMPARPMQIGLEQCCECGRPTISGIYVKRDPLNVRYPTITDEDEVRVNQVRVNA